MDSDKLKRRQSLKVIISEAIMVLMVIVTVVVLALVVSGYWVNSDFKVERQGMLQVSSVPSGADLDVDGESSWLQRTNTSKVLSSGEHTVTISKDGYDSWSKTINISEGLLYRIHYPRLFLQDRTAEKVLDTTGSTMGTISPDGTKLLLAGDTTEWKLVKLNSDTPEAKKLDISKFFPGTSLAEGATVGLFSGKIIAADWDHDSGHVLFRVEHSGNTEWVLLDVNNVASSINLTKEFGADFSAVKILDNTSSSLLAIQSGNLHKIDVPGKSISAVLIQDVYDFDHYESEVVFSAASSAGGYTVGLFKIGEAKPTELETVTQPTKVAISKFYDDMYITTLQENTVMLHKKADFAEPIASLEVSFTPEVMKVGHNGEFITMSSGPNIATLDMETNSIREWQVAGNSFGWIDNDMVYTVADGELIVYDFDGLNHRVLAKNVSGHFPTAITDNKWLYYFSDGSLIREKIIK